MGDGINDGGQSRVHILKQIDASLRRLQMDYVDLYQIHRHDSNTPIEETLRTLDGLVQQNKVRYLGASSMYAWQYSKMLWTSESLGLERFQSMQNHYNLCYREEEREMIPLCQDQKIALIPWSPLARGFLTGKYKRNEAPSSVRFRSEPELMKDRFFHPVDFDILDQVEDVAREKGVKPAQIALAWMFHKDYITAPILGASRVEHVEEAVEALEIKLSSSDIKRIEEPYKVRAISGHN
jgi:aryl-alcohol dehydrogenase (NADP+)